MPEGGHLQHIQKLQDRRVQLTSDLAEKVRLLRHFATIWQVRLNNADMSAYFYHQALDLVYQHGNFAGEDGEVSWHVAAYRKLVEHADTAGNADALVPLAQRGMMVIEDTIDAALVGRTIDVLFTPFDLTVIEVEYQGRPMGQARPHHIGRHMHPAVKPDATAPVEATGIDYLQLLEDAHQREVGQLINYPALADEGPAEPGRTPDEEPG